MFDNLDKTSLCQVQAPQLNLRMNSETTQLHNLDVHVQSLYRTTHLVHSSTMFFQSKNLTLIVYVVAQLLIQ